PAPAFELKDVAGARHTLAGLLQRGPALLAFYKTGCPVCQLIMPFLERMAGNASVQIIAVSQDDAEGTTAFNRRFGITFPTLLDDARAGYPASNAYGISSVPSLFLLESDGTVSKSFAGFSKRDLEAIGERAGQPPFRADEAVPEWRAG